MTAIDSILADTGHRPFDMPSGKWMYYQEWNRAVFLHWRVPMDLLRELVPQQMDIDTLKGDAYVSLVAFTMEKIRPRNLPALSFISDFDEINLRTYIDMDGKKGVYFLNIEAGKRISAWLSRTLSGLPYEKSHTLRRVGSYRSSNPTKGLSLHIDYTIGEPVRQKTALDLWLTERYCLYLDQGSKIFRYDIHHKEWPINNVCIRDLSVDYPIGRLQLSHTPDLVHYSDGVKVVAWERQTVV